MKIKDNSLTAQHISDIRQALITLIAQPDDRTLMPCPTCHQSKQQPVNSAQDCSASCRYTKYQLSSEPQKYPIEDAILPLVYAFYTLRLLTPCWSCEGHNDHRGDIFKIPKLWFYSSHDFYPKLIAQWVSTHKGEGKLNNHWGVRILPFSQTDFATTYSLEPLDVNIQQTQLSSLQQDVKTIAANIRQGLFKLAKHYIASADRKLKH